MIIWQKVNNQIKHRNSGGGNALRQIPEPRRISAFFFSFVFLPEGVPESLSFFFLFYKTSFSEKGHTDKKKKTNKHKICWVKNKNFEVWQDEGSSNLPSRKNCALTSERIFVFSFVLLVFFFRCDSTKKKIISSAQTNTWRVFEEAKIKKN